MATFIAQVSANNLTGTTSTTLAAPSLNVQAGDLLYAFAFHEGSATTITYTDSQTQSWTNRTAQSHANGDVHSRAGYFLSSAADSALVVTANFAAARPYRRICVLQFRPGAGETLTYDTEKVATGSPSPPATLASGAFTTAGASIICAGYSQYHSQTWTPGSGYTQASADEPYSQYKISGAGASENSQVDADNGAGTAEFTVNVIAFNIAAGGGGSSQTLTETMTLADAAIRGVFRPRTLSDAISAVDELIRKLIRGRVTSESLTVYDDPTRTIQMTFSDESVEVADGFVSWRRLARLSQDNLDLLDGVSKTVLGSGTVYARVLSETVELSDGFVSWRRLRRLIEENAELLDGFSKLVAGAGITYTKVMSDTITIIDSAGQRWTLRTAQLSDTTVLSDELKRALARVVILGESIEVVDGAVRFMRAVRVPTETLDASDELVRQFFPDQVFTVAIVFGSTDPFRFGGN